MSFLKAISLKVPEYWSWVLHEPKTIFFIQIRKFHNIPVVRIHVKLCTCTYMFLKFENVETCDFFSQVGTCG